MRSSRRRLIQKTGRKVSAFRPMSPSPGPRRVWVDRPTDPRAQMPPVATGPGGEMSRAKHRARSRRALLLWLDPGDGARRRPGRHVERAGWPAGRLARPPPPTASQPVIADTQSSNDDCGSLGFAHGILDLRQRSGLQRRPDGHGHGLQQPHRVRRLVLEPSDPGRLRQGRPERGQPLQLSGRRHRRPGPPHAAEGRRWLSTG